MAVIELEAHRLLKERLEEALKHSLYDVSTFHRRADGWYIEGDWIASSLKELQVSYNLAKIYV